MEGKERYIIDRFDEDIFDTKKEYYPSNQTICEIINKQDKRIKELEQENQKLKQQLAEKDKEIEYQESMKILAVENQNKKAIEQLEKVKGLIANHTQELWTCENDDIDVVLYEEIDKQIKKIQKGEE